MAQDCRRVLETSADGVLIADVETLALVFANPAVGRLLGRDPEELLRLTVRDIHPPDQLEFVLGEFRAQANGEKSVALDIPCLRKDGSVVFADVSTSAMMLDGRLCAVGFFRDATERRRTETSLRESRRKYQALVETTRTGYVILDETGIVLDANDEYVHLTGRRSLGEVLGKSVTEWTAPGDRERNATEVRKCLETGAVNDLEVDYVAPDGRVTPVEINATALEIDGHVQILSLVRDITDRRRSQESQLRELQRKIEFILGATGTGLDIIDADYNLRYVNEGWARIYGDYRGRKCHEYFMGAREVCPGCAVERAFREKKPVVSEEVLLREGNRYVQVTSIPFQDDNGEWLVAEVNVDISERKKAEAALKESEASLRIMSRSVLDAIIEMDENGHIVFWNPGAERIFGFTEPEALGRDVHEVMCPPQYREKYLHGVEHFLSSGEGPVIGRLLELTALKKDGTEFPIEISVSALRRGDAWHAAAVVRDISERKRAEGLLKESEERYRTLVENLSVGVYRNTPGPRGRFLFMNTAHARMFGYDSVEELMDQSVIAHYRDPEDRRDFLEAIRRDGFTRGYEVNLKKRDGTPIVGAVSARPHYDANGEIDWFDGVIEDVTERKAMERRLSETLRFTESLIETVPVPIFHKDAQGRYTGCNRAFEEFLGRSRESIVGRGVDDMAPPEIADTYAAKDRELLESGGSQVYEWKVKRPDGTEREVVFHKAVYADAAGRTAGIIGAILDVTDLKRAEEDRLRALVQHAYDVILVMDGAGTIEYESPAAERILGHGPEEYLGACIMNFVHEDDRPSTLAAMRRAVERKGEQQRLTIRIRHKNGSWVYVEAVGVDIAEPDDPPRLVVNYRDVTERQHTERALKESEARLRILAENTRDVIWACGLDMRFTYMSPSVEALLGHTPEECIRIAPEGTFPPENLAMVSGILREELEREARAPGTGGARTFVVEQIHRDGRRVPTEVVTSFLRDESGRVVGVMGVTRDITDRLKAEKALRDSEARFRSIVENSQDLIMLTRPDGIVEYLSPACERVIGHRPEDLTGRRPVFVHPEDQERVGRAQMTLKDGARIENIEYRFIGADGGTRWLSHSAAPLMEDGRVALVVSVVSNVTERREAEEALRSSEERFRNIVQAAPMGIHLYELKEDGRLVFLGANPAADQILCIAHARMEGLVIEEAFPALAGTEVPEIYSRICREGIEWHAEPVDYHDERVSGFFSVHAFQTAPGRMAAMFSDITDRKRTEDHLIESEARSRALADDLSKANVELREANRQLREIDQHKKRFLSAVAHELRTPLAVTVGAVDNLVSGSAGQVSDLQKHLLDVVSRNAARLGRLIENLLDLARGDEGRLTVRKEPCDLREPVRHAVESFEPLVRRQDLAVDFDAPSDPIVAAVEQDKIVQITGNLLDNALRHARRRIVVELRREDREVVLAVFDDGPGVSDENLPLLFRHFSRIDAPDAKSHIGLGLWIVRALAEAHGGSARAENVDGATRFVVRIPLD